MRFPHVPLRLVCLATLAFAGCDKGTDSSSPSATSQGAAGGGGSSAAPAEVRLGYFANLTHAQAVLGVSSGEFAAAVAPAKVTTKVFNAGPSLVEALFAGEIDLGYVGPGPALNAFAKSRGDVRVIAGAASNGVLIVARKDSGIEKLSDLAGKRIATPQHGNTQDIAARHYLTAELKQPGHDNVIPVANAEQAGMMERGQVDAAWAPEPWASLLVSQAGAKVIGAEKDLWKEKSFAITVVITTPKFLAEHPGVVEKILNVHRDWTARLAAEPDKHLPQLEAALFALTNKKLPAGVVKSALDNTSFTDDPQAHTFATFAQWSYDLNFARDVTDVTGLIDTSILRKLEASGPPATGAGQEVSANGSR
jgi:NitT/TauT family transport system substrate-binding protein